MSEIEGIYYNEKRYETVKKRPPFMNFKGFDPTSMQSKPWSKPFSFYGRERKNQHYVMQSIFAYSPPALLHRDSSCSSIWERDLISWKWAQGKILHAMMMVKRKKCVDKKWNECAHVQRIQRERHRPKHTCNVYIHNIIHIHWLWWWWWRRRTEKKCP